MQILYHLSHQRSPNILLYYQLYFLTSCIFYFLYKFIYFNWRLITLQYCSGFAIHWHGSTTGVHVFPIMNPILTSLPIPSLWVIPLLQPWAPCLMHLTWLEIYFTYVNIHVSTLFSQIIPPCLLPQSPKVCSLYLCLFCCLIYRVIVTIFLNCIYMR